MKIPQEGSGLTPFSEIYRKYGPKSSIADLSEKEREAAEKCLDHFKGFSFMEIDAVIDALKTDIQTMRDQQSFSEGLVSVFERRVDLLVSDD